MKLRRLIPRFSWRTLILFTLLATSGMGLRRRWMGWENTATLSGEAPARFLSGVNAWERFDQARFWDATEKRELALETGVTFFAGFKGIAAEVSGDAVEVHWRLDLVPDGIPPLRAGSPVLRSDDRRRGLSEHAVLAKLTESDPPLIVEGRSRVLFWQRLWPERWWGVFYLYELWATAILAALFLWSVRRDRRTLAALRPRPRS